MLKLPLLIWLWAGFDLRPNDAETLVFIRFLLEVRQEQTSQALARSTAYVSTFRQIFQREGVPSDLFWLALIESSFRTSPTSPTGAQGMFQFKIDTARAFGLRVTPREDQRNHPHLAAAACARYLRYLHQKFEDWDLVLAAYNLGEGDLRRTMLLYDAHTWDEVKPYVRRETQDYVAKVRAAAIIGNAHYAEQRAAKPATDYPEAQYHTVRKGDTLYNISKRFNVSIEQIRRLNGIQGNHIKIGQRLRLR